MNQHVSSPLVSFLNVRQAASGIPLDAVRPTLISGGQENQCLNNAMGLMEAEGHQVVSGWLYIRKPAGQRAQFTQHWWNFDESRGLYVDCSPSIEANAIHILDLEIAMYAAQKKDLLQSCVCSSVLYESGTFSLLDYSDDGGYLIRSTTSLVVDVLFARYFKENHVSGGQMTRRAPRARP
jgi:hypothetical protein